MWSQARTKQSRTRTRTISPADPLAYFSLHHSPMDYVPPLEVVSNMVGAGNTKGALPAKDLLIRGFLSGALTMSGHGNDASGIAAKIAAIADAKTLGYAKFGGFGVLTAVVKAILFN